MGALNNRIQEEAVTARDARAYGKRLRHLARRLDHIYQPGGMALLAALKLGDSLRALSGGTALIALNPSVPRGRSGPNNAMAPAPIFR